MSIFNFTDDRHANATPCEILRDSEINLLATSRIGRKTWEILGCSKLPREREIRLVLLLLLMTAGHSSTAVSVVSPNFFVTSLLTFLLLTSSAMAFSVAAPAPANLNSGGGPLNHNQQPQAVVLSASDVGSLVARSLEVLERSGQRQVFIGIAGAPGSGKSTIAQNVADAINNSLGDASFSIVLPMDGYHFPQSQLKAMGDEGRLIGDADATAGETTTFDDLMKRRGAPWTFDPVRLNLDLHAVKAAQHGSLPLYDRSISDPVPDQIHVTKDHRIIFCEGNYVLAFDDPAWKPLKEIWDDTWLIYVAEPVLKERLVGRHLKTWTALKEERFGKGRAGAEAKTESSDLKHARWVDRMSRAHAAVIIRNDD